MSKHIKTLDKKVYIYILAGVVALLALVGVLIFALKNKQDTPVSNSSSQISSVPSPSSIESSSSTPEPEKQLSMTSPSKLTLTTTSPQISFAGSCDPKAPLTINGETVKYDENGDFSFNKDLKIGKNTFEIKHKEIKQVYNITYRYVVINSYSPTTSQKFESGSAFGVSVKARTGSVIKATFNGQTITLAENPRIEEKDSIFKTFNGQFKLPSDNKSDLNLGKIEFTGSNAGITETFYSGSIVCKKPVVPVIAEIIHDRAETFDAYSTNDWSSPKNIFLPKGTVDYVKGTAYYSGSPKKEYTVLRCGKEVYTYIDDKPKGQKINIIRKYEGVLPDHNEIKLVTLTEDKRYTTISFSCLFKAPFNFELLPQSYQNPGKQDFSVSSFTAKYIDITFHYATVFEGEIVFSAENPLFSSAQVVQNSSGHKVLRLHLKKTGGFYGWDANYNANGELCFEFLHPAKVVSAENLYGADLTGVVVAVDAGHNGPNVDVGALGISSGWYESERNLNLAKKVKEKLESIGATVIMLRSYEGERCTYQERINRLKRAKADYCVSIHHDSSTSSAANGYSVFYGTAYSKAAASFVDVRTKAANIYDKKEHRAFRWHYFFLARTSNCPVVLTENGFMSNQGDFAGIKDNAKNDKKADAIVKGIVDYFLSIQ